MKLRLLPLATCAALLFVSILFVAPTIAQERLARTSSFNSGWKFFLGDVPASDSGYNDANWRQLDLPHDWSIELPFDSTSPTGTGGGALRGGTGWYRKTFTLPATEKGKQIAVLFDGVYRNSEVWINGHYLGKRPNGYISFQYDLTPYVHFGREANVIAVKADNSQQPNSRWYSGSGIYRNVWLIATHPIHMAQWGTYVTTPDVSDERATVQLQLTVTVPPGKNRAGISAHTIVYNNLGKAVASASSSLPSSQDTLVTAVQQLTVHHPSLWSVEQPYLYKAVTTLVADGKTVDRYTTPFGIRYFSFYADKGFFLNGQHVKITGVCNHHDLGCLGTAVNTRALERQLQILKDMGINGIRTSHNPPAPELLDLCDKMGFIVMDEAFDMWRQQKTTYDYHLDFDNWYKQDLTDQVVRDRNHPSVFIWSVGNEIQEQWKKGNDTSGAGILRTLQSIVKSLDNRPTVTANNEVNPGNVLLQANVTDLIGYNYNHQKWDARAVHNTWGRKPFIVTESVSALQTRGRYDMPSDSIRRWPARWDLPVENANPDLTCSAYENCSSPWGSTHIETLKQFLKNDNISGMFVWTGFDYIGEPTPYPWPARSSYFGIVDLAGFPKDVYYLYQSLFTRKNVLHLFPHWNWATGQTIDLWAYYNNADEVELFINGQSQGIRKKHGDDMHVMWRVKYVPGTVKAISRKNGKVVATATIRTAGAPAKIILTADKTTIAANGHDLSFVTVKVVDKEGNLVPSAQHLIRFALKGAGSLAGVDNGCQTDLSSFKANSKKAFNGLALAVIQSKKQAGPITLSATADGLEGTSVVIQAR
jgi:beta-galactosidase